MPKKKEKGFERIAPGLYRLGELYEVRKGENEHGEEGWNLYIDGELFGTAVKLNDAKGHAEEHAKKQKEKNDG